MRHKGHTYLLVFALALLTIGWLVFGLTWVVRSRASPVPAVRRVVRTGDIVEVAQSFSVPHRSRSIIVLEDRWEHASRQVRDVEVRRRVIEPVPWWARLRILPATAWRVRWTYQSFLPPKDAPSAYTLPPRRLVVADAAGEKLTVLAPEVPLWVVPSREADDDTLAPEWEAPAPRFRGHLALLLLAWSLAWGGWLMYDYRRPQWVFASLRKELLKLARQSSDVRPALVRIHRALSEYAGATVLASPELIRRRPHTQAIRPDLDHFFGLCEQAFYQPAPFSTKLASFRDLERLVRKLAKLERRRP